jgi:uncharacterized protein (UPF0261 family)
MSLYDPEADRTFVDELKMHIIQKISIIELDLHLNTPEFAEEAVNRFLKLYQKGKPR